MARLATIVFLQIALTSSILSAQTNSWSWSYSGSAGAYSTSASGNFITTDEGGGNYLVTDVTGVWNGVNITGALAPQAYFNDNMLTASAPYVDSQGVAFSTADNHWVSLWSSNGITEEWASVAGQTDLFTGVSDITLTVTPDAAPWEPADGVAIAGIAIFGWQQYRKHRRKNSAQYPSVMV